MRKKRQYGALFFILPVVIFLDIVFVIAADLTGFILRFGSSIKQVHINNYLIIAPFIVALRLLSFYVFSLYDTPKYKSNFESLINTIKAVTASSIFIVIVLFFAGFETFPRSIAVFSWICTICFIAMWRFLAKEFVELFFNKNIFQIKVLIIGCGAHARDIYMHISKNTLADYDFLGFIDTKTCKDYKVTKDQILGCVDDLQSIIKQHRIDEVIIADPGLSRHKLSEISDLLSKNKLSVKSIAGAYDNIIADIIMFGHAISYAGPVILTKKSSWYWAVKRIMDILFSAILLVLTAPLLCVSILLIKTTSKGPVFYMQKRTGRYGRPFIIYKLRTMYINSEGKHKPMWAQRNDNRITPVGLILRRFRIDELPQLVNVLKNEMSLIGPRPERPYFTTRLIKKIPFFSKRLYVKPGITGWAQVNFRYTDTEKDAEEKLLYDIFYVENMSLSVDALIALKTIKVILTGQGAQ
jgi:exopolysaccharide biosynthesis polyprenyl glycosylphosphotransferase